MNLLIEKIRVIDQILTTSKKNNDPEFIDVNQQDWVKKINVQNEAFIKEHKESISDISNDLVLNFEKLNTEERTKILEELSNTKHLKKYLHIPFYINKSFKDSLVLLIIKNLDVDTRDSLMELNELLKEAKKDNINYKKIIIELIPIADDTNKHEMGSMKDILMNLL